MSSDRAYRRFVDTHLAIIPSLARGKTPARRLGDGDRRAIAVAGTAPTHLLTLNSADLDRQESASAWVLFRKHLERKRGRPLIYLSAPARSVGGGGYHRHVLLWEFLYAPTLHGIARKVGFGGPDIQRIGESVEDKLFATVYVFGQTESVLGSAHHRRHRDRGQWAHRFSRTSDEVLKRLNPQLLSALEMARDRSVSDKELVEMLPRFITNYAHDMETPYVITDRVTRDA
jgi:hypothetical protein